MRRFVFLLIGVSFLGTMVGCNTCGTRGCGLSSTNSCRTSGCATGRCSGDRTHSHGICDCEHDDYCTSRTPWIRNVGSAPITEQIAPPAKALPDVKTKL